MNLAMSTTSIITDGDTITFVCSGDVGKPPGKFRFQHFRSDHMLYKNYSSSFTSISEISDKCSYYRTSNMTLQITSEDNKAVIRCVVESPMSEISMFVDSEPLEVYYAVKMPTIVKLPTKTDYLVGIDTSISLKCNTDGNPKPSYVWYTDNAFEALSTSENLTITDASTTNRCIYTCFVSNALNCVIHTKRVQMHVCKGEGSENTAVIVLGTVCGSIILVLCVVLFGVIHNKIMSLRIRNLNDRSLDYVNTIQQQDLSLYESVGHALEVRHYDQPSTGEHQYTNTNLSGSVDHPLDVHHYEQPSTGEHQYTNTNLSGN
ncbi:cell adhesion molecule 2-like [Mytilus edulis]|uniref:cell adhesion molecule 2-like n=1 Tax=Mytilus edulis TaxID=6550 RepID=UPI0039EFFA34